MSPSREVHGWALGIFASVLMATLGAVIFWDLNAPQTYVAGVLYVGLVLAAVLTGRPWFVQLVAGVSIVAMILCYLIRVDPQEWATWSPSMFNRLVAVAVVVIAAAVGTVILRRGAELSRMSGSLAEATQQVESQSSLVSMASGMGRLGGWSTGVGPGERLQWSDEVAVIHGETPGIAPTVEDSLAYYLPAHRERMRAALRRCADHGISFVEQAEIVRPGSGSAWVSVMGEPVRDEYGTVVGMQGACQDITAWKQAQDAADEERNRFVQLTESLTFIVWAADATGAINFFNQALLDYSGVTREELFGGKWRTIVHPDDVDRVRAAWKHAVEAREPYDIKFRFRRHDGAYRWHHLRAVAETDEQGRVLAWWGNSIDIDDHIQLQKRAEELARDRQDVLESIGDGVFALDREWRFTYLNRSGEEFLQRSAEDLVGKRIWDEFPEAKEGDFFRVYQSVMQTGEPESFIDFYAPLNAWYEVSATPSANGITVYFRDTTELRTLSEQLSRSQRLESLGRLTGGIAHDFNNLLTVVIGGAEAIAEEPEASASTAEMAALIRQAAARGADLTHHLLAFARRQPLAPRAVDVSAEIESLLPLLRRTLHDSISIVVELDHDLPPANADTSGIESAILNLSINARDAMPEGGTLTIETAVAHLDQAYATAHGEVKPGKYVVVSVSDSGTGVDPLDLPQLFDPFFTTKPGGEGSGLGLAMVWGFAKQSGGHASVYSEVGTGSTFRLYLPVATGAVTAAPPEDDQTDLAPDGHGHILLVEDDLLVVQFAVAQLRSRGYQVTVAGSGPQALEELDSMPTVDLLFTDVMMPGGMTGRQLAEKVVELRTGTPVLYTSGYTENVIVHNGKLDAGVRLLAKPYSSKELATKVREAMSASRAGTS